MEEKPRRHFTHILEDKSRKFFENYIPNDWIIHSVNKDYGIDYSIEICENGFVKGTNFSVQIKAKRKEINKKYVTAILKRSTINYIRTRLEPLLIIVYVENENMAYWNWFDEKEIDLTLNKNTYQLKLPTTNRVAELDWNKISKYVNSVFSKRELLYGFNEIDISKLDKHTQNAWLYFFRKEYEAALVQFKIISKVDNRDWVFSAIAMCHYKLYHYSDAMVSINKALEISDATELWLNKAAILVEDGIQNNELEKILESKKIFAKYINQDSDASLHFNFANSLSHTEILEDLELAKKEYLICLKKNPNFTDAWKNLGTLYNKLKQFKEEIDCYNKALSIEPSHPQALWSKGATQAWVFKKYKLGLSLMKKAVNLYPQILQEFPHSYYWIANSYYMLKKYDEALYWLDKGLEYNPSNKYLINLKATILYKIWKINKKYVNYAKDFFENNYKLYGNLYSLKELCLLLLELNESEQYIFGIVKKKNQLFEDITYSDIQSLNLKLKDHIIYSIPYIVEYYKLRSVSVHNIFLTSLDTSNVSLYNRFLNHSQIIWFIIFGLTNHFIKKRKNPKDIIKKTFLFLENKTLHFIPRLSLLLKSSDNNSVDEKIEELSKIMIDLSRFSLFMMAEQMGYHAGSYGWPKEKIDKLFNSKTIAKIFSSISVSVLRISYPKN